MRNTRMTRRRTRSGNRTRTLFFALIAIMLGVLAFSLNAQIINSAALMQIYIAASILAVGIVVIHMLGLLGQQHGDEGSAYDSDGGDDGGHDGGDAGDHGFGHDAASGLSEVDTPDGGGLDLDYAGGDDAIGSHSDGGDDGDTVHLHDVEHDSVATGRGPVLEAIRYLRMFVYFCLGFGLVGLALLATDRTAQASLIFASVAGVGTVLLARTFYRFQPRDTGEVMSDDELLLEQGAVIVPLDHKNMGKVRIQIGMQVHEPYALAAHEGEKYARGDMVRVIKVSDESVYVEGV